MIPTMMSSTTTVKSAGGPVGIQQQPQSSSLRLIRLEVINQHKGIEGVGVGEQLKVVHLRISDTGVEIIEEGQAQLEEALARNEIDENTINSKGKRLTSLNVPLHIVQEETTRPSMAARTSTGSSNSSTTTINDDGLHRNLLHPIEVPLQLGHEPIKEEAGENKKAQAFDDDDKNEKAILPSEAKLLRRIEAVVNCEVQTENPTTRHVEVQTTACEEYRATKEEVKDDNVLAAAAAINTAKAEAASSSKEVQESSSQTDPSDYGGVDYSHSPTTGVTEDNSEASEVTPSSSSIRPSTVGAEAVVVPAATAAAVSSVEVAAEAAQVAVLHSSRSATTTTSETQTTSIEQSDFSSQTLVRQETSEAITQTEVLSEEIVFEEEYTEAREVELEQAAYGGNHQLPQRPLTLPGSSIDLDLGYNPGGLYSSSSCQENNPRNHNPDPRTRTVSPTNLKVQDDLVARVLLEHLGTVFPQENPRNLNSVNYLDLSRLGEEGETPCSDEIWLAVEGGSNISNVSDAEGVLLCDDEDKFLTTDDTETYSVYTDRMAGVDGGGSGGGNGSSTLQLAPSSANLLGSEAELDRLGGASSFDVEEQETRRLQGVLASELVPLHNTVQSTDQNVVTLSSRFGNMENLIGTLCSTVENLQGIATPGPHRRSSAALGDQDNEGGGGDGTTGAPMTPGATTTRIGGLGTSIQDIKKPDIIMLDQLVSRIEHLSSDVSNMDNTRQLREDNLILRKELQTYREREVQMMNRLESLERSLGDISATGGHSRSQQDQHRSSRRPRSRRSSIGSNRSTPELPPIIDQNRSKSIDPPRSSDHQVEKPPRISADPGDPKAGSGEGSGRGSGGSDTEQQQQKSSSKLDKIVKPPLLNNGKSSSKSNKKALLRRTSNGSSSSAGSGNEGGGINASLTATSTLDVRTIQKRKPITPTLEIDFLETEIQTVRSDNSILRQDINVYREREHQLYRRNQELQTELISLSSRNTPVDGDGRKSQMDISVDFVTDEAHGGPKAVFNAKKDQSQKQAKKEYTSDSDTGVVQQKVKKAASKENLAVPKSKNGKNNNKQKTSSSSSVSSDESAEKKAVKIQDDPPKNKDFENTKAATGVPKTKNGKNGKGKPGAKNKTGKNGGGKSSESEDGREKLVDDDKWKVTVTSEHHELETTSDSESKTVIVKPKIKAKEEVKEEVKAAKKAEAKKASVKKVKTEKKEKDIIAPPMFPAPRPPRGYVPPKPVPNASYGVNGAVGSLRPKTSSGRDSMMAGSDTQEITHQMLFKQEPRDSLVDASPVPPRTPGPMAPGPLLTDIPYPLTPTRQLPHPPICQIRESPDGANSSKLDDVAKCGSRSDTACGFKEITEDSSSNVNNMEKKKTNIVADNTKQVLVNKQLTKINNKLETKKKDVVRDFVWKEIEPNPNMTVTPPQLSSSSSSSSSKIPRRKFSKLPIKFKDLKPASVAKNRAKLSKKSSLLSNHHSNNNNLQTLKSKSTDNLFDKYRKKSNESLLDRYTNTNKNESKSQSISRLPTLSAFDEERIIWMKSYEDEIALENERRARTVLSRQVAVQEQSSPMETTSASEDQQSESSSSNSASTCISRGTSPYVRLQQKRTEQLDRLHHELSLQPGINTPTLNKNANEIETGEIEIPAQDENTGDKDLSWSAMTSGPSVEEDSGNVDPNSLDTTFPIMSQDSLETIQSPTPPKEPENSTITKAEEDLEQKEIIENSPDDVKPPLVDSLEETTGPNTNSSTEESKKRLRRSMKKKERELAEDRRRSRSRKKQVTNPLSAECFLVSRGWQLDQTRLLRSLDRIQRAHFGRVQLATTINRCVESIRPHLDAVVIHVGNQELIEAAHSVVTVTEHGENVRDSAAIGLSVAGSVASVLCRHIISAANQNRGTQFIISLPLPVSLSKTSLEADIHFTELRRMFNATVKANCSSCSNIQCCDNENLSGSTKLTMSTGASKGVPPNTPPDNPEDANGDDEKVTKILTEDGKYILENHQVTAAGMKKLSKNWENCLSRIFRAADGELMLRRSSESSGINTGGSSSDSQFSKNKSRNSAGNLNNNNNPAGISGSLDGGNKSSNQSSSSPSDSLDQRAPWKPC